MTGPPTGAYQMTGRGIFGAFVGAAFMCAILIGGIFWLVESTHGEALAKSQAERRECAASLATPEIGSFVKMRLDGRTVQVVGIQIKHNPCRAYAKVRVALHGIAHDGGRWSTARPEVYPVITVSLFELEF